jgi:hypothetical protein
MKYKIWDKQEPIVTPSNEYFPAEEYIEKFCPAARVEALKFVVADDAVNGAFFNSFSGMVAAYASAGVQFSEDMTDQEHLDAITAWEAETATKARADAEAAANTPSADERIAAALEFQNMMMD